MAVRTPIRAQTDTTIIPNQTQLYEYGSDLVEDITEFAGWVHSQQPSTELRTTGGAGTLLANQAFSDTYYVAGAYTTRVDRYSTAAETPNIVLTTDTYSRIREIDNTGSQPTGDSNNFQFPLYLDSQGRLRAMSRQDFMDTFVTPAIPDIVNGGTGTAQGGTYFMTTSATPTGGTIVSSTPAATNSVSNLAAYSGSGIPEAIKQTTDTNYYIARVEYIDDDYFISSSDSLPIYFDAGTETIKVHSSESWRDLLGPFLRYYIGSDPQYKISYNINGSGTTRGTSYADTRRTPSGTNRATRFVNANDYRTQEFPTGTTGTVAGTGKTLKMVVGSSSATYSLSSNPATNVNEGQSITFTMATTNVANGSQLAYTITGIGSGDLSSGSVTGNITINSNTGSTSITLANDATTEGTEVLTFACAGQSIQVNVLDTSTTPPASSFEQIRLEGTSGSPEITGTFPLSDNSIAVGWRFMQNGVVYSEDADDTPTQSSAGHQTWCTVTNPIRTYYIRITTPTTPPGYQTITSNCEDVWVGLNVARYITISDNRTAASYADEDYTFTVQISASSTGGNWTSTSQYDDTPGSEYTWEQEPWDFGNTLYVIKWNGVVVASTTFGNSATTSITGDDNRTYTRGALYATGDSGEPDQYYVSQTINEVTGYYKSNYDGGA